MGTLLANLLISWDGATWTDESDYLVSANGTFSFSAAADFLISGGGIVNQATIVLSNANNRYIPNVSGLDFFQRHVRLGVDQGAGVKRIFSGVIHGVRLTSPNPGTASQLVLECHTMEAPYLQRKFDMTIADFNYLHRVAATEYEFFDLIIRIRLATDLTLAFDPGTVSFPWLWLDDESVLEECWKLAAACGGVMYTNVLGHLIYKNATSGANNVLNPRETLSRNANSYSISAMDMNQDDLYSDVVVEISTRSIGDTEELWLPEDYADLVVPPNDSLVVNATFSDPAYSITDVEWEAISNAGTSMTSSVSLTRVDYAQKSQLTFTNLHATAQAIIPYIRVHGVPVVGRVSFERVANSTSAFWNTRDRRTRSVRQNAYVQTPVQGKYLADIILAESEEPRTVVTLSGLPGDPDRFIGQTVRIQDSRLKNVDIVGQIEHMAWQLTQTYQQTITVQDFGNIYMYAPYFTLNSATNGVIGGTRKVFY